MPPKKPGKPKSGPTTQVQPVGGPKRPSSGMSMKKIRKRLKELKKKVRKRSKR